MPTMPNEDSPLSDSFAEARSYARQQRRRLEEGESSRARKLTAPLEQRVYNLRRLSNTRRRMLEEGESSRAGDLTAPVEQRAYNLRPCKVDSVTLQRRSEFETRRMHQKQRRKQLAEEEKSIKIMCSQIKAMMDHLAKGLGQSDANADKENIHTSEVLNAGESALRNEWHPYSYTPDVGYSCTLKEASWEVEKLALQVSPSVVVLLSLTGGKQLFACSGTIYKLSTGVGFIVTVANLVRDPDTDELAENPKIQVYLQNDEVLDGHLTAYDFYHNICLIKINVVKPVHLPENSFSSNIEAINFVESHSKDVVALGRDRESHYLWVRTGKIIPKDSEFDCEELLVSSCRISKEAVGGLLMDFDGNIIGMNYYHSKETPFIPSTIVSKCLLQLEESCKVVRPMHGLRFRNLYTEGHSTNENVQTNLFGVSGVIIKKLEESGKASGLNEGDIIDQVNGVHFSNAAELGGILLDIGAKHVDSNMMGICIKFGVRGSDIEKTVVVQKSTVSGLNRWSFPKPIIVRYYCSGDLIREEWYTLAF